MPLYWDRLIADTTDLMPEEFGVYMRLMYRQWTKGSIPASIDKQSRLGGVTTRAMRSISESIGSRLHAHPSIPDAVYSPFMEIVREEMRQRSIRRKNAGKRGGEAKRDASNAKATIKQCDSNERAIDKQTPAFQSPISNKSTSVDGTGAPQQPPLGVQEPSEMGAWRILDAAWPVISGQHELAVKRRAWRDHNKRFAKDLADNGKTPEQVTAMLTLAYTHPEGKRFYGGITTLAKLIEHWPKLAALENEPQDDAETRKAMMRGDYLPIC